MSTSSTNNRENVFRHQDLTRIQGEPTFSTLKLLARELKANAKSVFSNLGGAQHGHLGLVLTPAQYATISATAFVRPTFPPALVVPVGTTRIAEDELKRNHTEAVRVFREVLGVENALKQQLLKTIDTSYLAALYDPQTFDLQGNIQQILQYLLTTYGSVTPELLNEEDEKVQKMHYNSNLPIDIIFNAIDDLAEVGIAAEIPYSQQQKIPLATNIFLRSGKFKDYLKEWKRRLPADKSWANLKTDFRQAHIEVREYDDDTIAAIQHAHIAQQVIDGIAHLIPPPADTPPDTLAEDLEEAPTPPANAALAVTTGDHTLVPSLLQQMTTMQTMMMQMQSQMNSDMRGSSQGRGRGRSAGGRGRGRNGRGNGGTRNDNNHTLYCWTHGLCMHTGRQCETPAAGHKVTATLANKMGGSTRNCEDSVA
jgi:hypothetical protein